MSRRGVGPDRLEALRARTAALLEAALDGAGSTTSATRRAAFEGHADDPVLARYVDLVRRHADAITDEDVAGLRAAGLDDDAIVEITIAAALGAGSERLRTGLALLGRTP